MRFWKFEHPGEAEMQSCIAERRLPKPDIQFPGLLDTYDYPAGALKAGDGVLLATLSGEEARFFAVGKVIGKSTETGLSTVSWTATKFGKFPNEKGGMPQWRTKTAFEITKEPAKRYGLLELIQYYVKNDASINRSANGSS